MDKELLARNLAVAFAKTVSPATSWDQIEAQAVTAGLSLGKFWTLSAEAMVASMEFLDDPMVNRLVNAPGEIEECLRRQLDDYQQRLREPPQPRKERHGLND